MRHEWRIQTKSLGLGEMPNCLYQERSQRHVISQDWRGQSIWMRGWALEYVNRQVMGLSLAQKKLGLFFLCCDFSLDICGWWKQNSVWNLGAAKRSMHETELLLVWEVWERRTSHLSVWEEHFRECSNDKGTMGPLPSGCILALVKAKMLFVSKCFFISSLMWISAIIFWDR